MIAQFYIHNDKDVLNRISRYFIWSLKEAPSVRKVSQEKRYILTLYKNERRLKHAIKRHKDNNRIVYYISL